MKRVLPFQNNPKDLDPSCKMDLDVWDCFVGKKLSLITIEIQYVPDGTSFTDMVNNYVTKYCRRFCIELLDRSLLCHKYDYVIMDYFPILKIIKQASQSSR